MIVKLIYKYNVVLAYMLISRGPDDTLTKDIVPRAFGVSEKPCSSSFRILSCIRIVPAREVLIKIHSSNDEKKIFQYT